MEISAGVAVAGAGAGAAVTLISAAIAGTESAAAQGAPAAGSTAMGSGGGSSATVAGGRGGGGRASTAVGATSSASVAMAAAFVPAGGLPLSVLRLGFRGTTVPPWACGRWAAPTWRCALRCDGGVSSRRRRCRTNSFAAVLGAIGAAEGGAPVVQSAILSPNKFVRLQIRRLISE